MVNECPEPKVCNNCGQEGHMVRDCEPEKTRQYVDEEGDT